MSELPRDGATRTYCFSGVIVADRATGGEVRVEGPVDLDAFAPLHFRGVRADGVAWARDGLTLLVVEEDLVPIPERRLNVVAMRLLEFLHADLESGAYLTQRYAITGIGSPPKTHFSVAPAPIVPPAGGTG